ncbi:glucokinase [Pseudoalteromonas denitrificans]|uniref:Glucokinase n=1 Tax=Pseudoalteromonas denitrificans DSM 6059 TaxID=1123010 RepID=A0A1I1UCB7_9GAMM|nr:glucokinase [Pseudoalteromonas denitrificans]SFD68482.1 glucokinase [Pseudoalteromonas denitrificans DSM 6059]
MHHDNAFEPIIVADIGGTNARFALVTAFDKSAMKFKIEQAQTYPSADFSSLESALSQYVEFVSFYAPKYACLAVAGPIKGESVRLTNLGWNFVVSDVKQEFGFEQLSIINDFAAFAYAAPYLDKTENLSIKSGYFSDNENIAVIGPGTGFGAAALVKNNQHQTVLSCEAGHITLAAVTQLQFELLAQLKKQYDHVSVETVFSGIGLTRLYQAMAKIEQVEVDELNPSQITQRALDGHCEICLKTLEQFCSWLGSVAGDLALTFGARGGVFIGGGILPRIQHILLDSQFSQNFVKKGIMTNFVQDIPVTLVVQDNIPLIGAAACIANR